ncbi:uncharacterized protein METZ01_LOCUS10255, partial [marine metagenome]
VAANLTMLVMLIGGFFAWKNLTTQVFPTLDLGVASISVPYPGATPSEVEEGITRRLEEAILGIDGVDRVRSTAIENYGVVSAELKDRVDVVKVRNDIETAVDRLADFPPLDAENPDVVIAETVSDVMALVVSSEGSEMELRKGAELLEQALLALPSISLVSMDGARDYEIAIEVSEEALRRYDLSMSQVAAAVRESSLNLSAGELRTDAGDLLLRTNAKRVSGREFEDVVLRASPDGSILRLRDVARIRDGFADLDLINQFQGRQSVVVKVQKSETEDAIGIAADIRAMLNTFEPPQGIDVAVLSDQTVLIESRISLLVKNGLLGFVLVFLFLVLMLDLRLAIWVAMGVPISFLGAFLFFDAFDVNINMISLFGLIIVIGVVVDDAVVVGENIAAERELGRTGALASINGVKGVFAPVFVGVLTTMVAFGALALVSGTFGQIMRDASIVVVVVLTMSLVEAFFILPAHLAHPGNWSRYPLDVLQQRIGNGVNRFRDEWLVPKIARAVSRRWLAMLAWLGLILVAFALVTFGAVKFVFFPALESDRIGAQLTFPIGTPFEITRAAAETIAEAATEVNARSGNTAFESTLVTIGGRISLGTGGPGGAAGSTFASHIASVQIQLNSDSIRKQSAAELERLWRAEVGVIPGTESLSFQSDFIGGGSSVDYELSHQNDASLLRAIEVFKTEIQTIEGMTELQDSSNPGKRQYDIELTRAGEAAGLSPADIARQLRQHFFGEEVHRIQRGRQELKVMVRYPRDQRNSTRDLMNVRIRLADGTEAPLSTMARTIESRSYSEINRVDGRRIVSVSGKVDTEVTTPTDATSIIDTTVIPGLVRDFPGLRVDKSGFSREQTQDLASILSAFVFALLIMYALLAAELKSYVQPLIIAAGIPAGVAGAIIGHLLLGYDISFISIFGMVALTGVVVNDSLVMIDRYNNIRRTTALTSADAIVLASQRRFRAIFLTTATTSLGLAPMLFERSISAQFLIPMAVSLAIGILFASVVILFIVPALVAIVEEDLYPFFLRRVNPSAEKQASAPVR